MLLGTLTTQKLLQLLSSEPGLPARIGQMSTGDGHPFPVFSAQQVIAQNVAADIAERSTGANYPLVQVYCSKLSNSLTEKFRKFSGQAQMAAEVRVSQDRLEGLESAAQMYADAVTQVLEQSRGDWGDGMFYCGAYEINYGPVKSGGKNFTQTAKITFALEISI